MTLIAFMGKAGSGKDLSCTYVHELAKLRYLATDVVSFADPIKRQVADTYHAAYGIPCRHFFGTQADKAEDWAQYGLPGVCGRDVMKDVGEGYRASTPEIWVQLGKIKIQQSSADVIMISDCRRANEVDMIHNEGGIVVRLLRGQNNDPHPTESEMDSVQADFTIDNRGMSKADLRWHLALTLSGVLGWDALP